jgi:hypothetical protein
MRKSKRNTTKRSMTKRNKKSTRKSTRKSIKCVYTDEAKRIIQMTKYIKKNRTSKKH